MEGIKEGGVDGAGGGIPGKGRRKAEEGGLSKIIYDGIRQFNIR